MSNIVFLEVFQIFLVNFAPLNLALAASQLFFLTCKSLVCQMVGSFLPKKVPLSALNIGKNLFVLASMLYNFLLCVTDAQAK
jgi:hypothetical protein